MTIVHSEALPFLLGLPAGRGGSQHRIRWRCFRE